MTEFKEAYMIAKQLLEIANKISKKIVRMNFHPENILLVNGNIKIIDFNFIETTSKKPVKVNNGAEDETFCYNSSYCPPEVLKEEKKVDLNKVDVYCWGMTIYHFITKKTYKRLEWEMNEYKVKPKKYDEFIKEINKIKLMNDKKLIISNFFISILKKVLAENPTKRPNFKEIKSEFDSHDFSSVLKADKIGNLLFNNRSRKK